jgi:hypothetical protein
MSSPSDFPANWAVIEHLRDELELARELANTCLNHPDSAASVAFAGLVGSNNRSNSFPKRSQEQRQLNTAFEEVKQKLKASKSLQKQTFFQMQHVNHPGQQQPELRRRRQAGELSASGRLRYAGGSGRSTASIGASDCCDSAVTTAAHENGNSRPRTALSPARAPLGALDMNDPMTIASWLVCLFFHL